MNLPELFADIPLIAFILFGIGVVLLIVEMTMPGFGLAGGSALVAFALAIVFAADTFLEGLIFTGIVLAISAVIVITFLVLLSKGKFSAGFILKAKNSNSEGFSSAAADLRFLIGQEGVAQTALRPAGKVAIGGNVYDVVSSGAFIASGKSVRVMEVQGNRIVVAQPVEAGV